MKGTIPPDATGDIAKIDAWGRVADTCLRWAVTALTRILLIVMAYQSPELVKVIVPFLMK